MSISWINISIKKQHNTTRVITLQTRTTHALSTTTPETGGFLQKKLTATEETGADWTKNASRKGNEDSNKSIYEHVADKRTTSIYKCQEREEETGAKDGTEQGPKGASTRRTGAGPKGAETTGGHSNKSIYESADKRITSNAAQCKNYQAIKTERQSARPSFPTGEPGISSHQRRLAHRASLAVLVPDTVRVQDRS